METEAEISVQSAENGVLVEDYSPKHVVPPTRTASRTTSPSRQKVVKTKPRGFDEETVTTFAKAIHADVQMEDNIWALLPEDLLVEVLARVPPFFIFRLRSVCRRWNSILNDSSFLAAHSKVPSHGPCLLTCTETLFLVRRIGLYSTLQSMRIWELDHAKTVWVEICRMPPNLMLMAVLRKQF
ncbi:F-box/kelch-repeat protein [Ananas comosus]|uniref:F-box/kelch-repeat protein n=1 Tax=Ananas comosus TaxID=4615 RepID=A0A199V6S5_ANACO|nr:F-box/kelch-repeat protein [Ananas comosus]